jgi:hypothetical protein
MLQPHVHDVILIHPPRVQAYGLPAAGADADNEFKDVDTEFKVCAWFNHTYL